ncbi:MAG: zf-HC2 domain-containing protein [Candidatus Omnitrophica bacterium]|jgi:anti-sigma factor RsiW|nr:zf-HC2 domain-containing protein [Candidatus Omnitrophota bacterium]
MIRCGKIQELLKTDFLDGQLNPREKQSIDGHLKQCPECRSLVKELQAQRALFQSAESKQIPERVWENIRGAIITERLNREEGLSLGAIKRLRDLLFKRRPAFILATSFSAIIIFAVIFTGLIQNKMALSKQEAAESLAGYSLSAENGYLLNGLGTNIEEYFL